MVILHEGPLAANFRKGPKLQGITRNQRMAAFQYKFIKETVGRVLFPLLTTGHSNLLRPV